MQILQQNSESVQAAAAVLNRGGVIAFATETVYGIGCRCDNGDATSRMRRIKGRDADKPFQILIPQADWASRYTADLDPRAERIMQRFFPGPLTLVLPGKEKGETVGLRVPDSLWLLKLMRSIDCAIAASSANISGEPPATNAMDAAEIIGGRVDLLIDGGNCTEGTASTVASLLDDELRIIRPGKITLSDLKSAAQG